jgi:hypothetical protein
VPLLFFAVKRRHTACAYYFEKLDLRGMSPRRWRGQPHRASTLAGCHAGNLRLRLAGAQPAEQGSEKVFGVMHTRCQCPLWALRPKAPRLQNAGKDHQGSDLKRGARPPKVDSPTAVALPVGRES